MDNNLCPKYEKCPLFNGKLLSRKGAEESYKNLFCKAGESKYSTCKRYMVSEKVGKCADWILPNCSLSLDEIMVKMKERGELAS